MIIQEYLWANLYLLGIDIFVVNKYINSKSHTHVLWTGNTINQIGSYYTCESISCYGVITHQNCILTILRISFDEFINFQYNLDILFEL